MYNKHFGLGADPFRITPDIRRFFGGGCRAAILDTLVYAIGHGEGMVKVTGEIGTGKTMLCRMLQARLPANVELVYLSNPSLDRDDILRAIATDLDIPNASGLSRLHLQQALQGYLLAAHGEGRQVVVFIEEAQRMPADTLEEIRLLSNLETGQAKLLQLVLFGQPELDELLDTHELRQLRDRITHSLHLAPLSAAEVRDYVRFRLHSAGYTGDDLLSWAAYRYLARASGGLIRRLHVIADKALLSAFARGAKRVGWRDVYRAAGDGRPRRSSRPVAAGAGLVTGLLAALALTLTLGESTVDPDAEQARSQSRVAYADAATLGQKIDQRRQLAREMKPAAGGSLLSNRLQATHRLLQKPTDGRLTIQLLLSDDADPQKMEQLLGSQAYAGLVEDVYLYRGEVGGRPRWHLFYGDFESRPQALAALADLPERIRRNRPYLRSLSALQTARTPAGLPPHKEGQG